jgi:putative tricarboxylic transport membrane protein
MSDSKPHRLRRPETLVAIGLLAVAGAFVWPTLELSAMSALLPAAMLGAMMVLAVVMLVVDQRKAAAGQTAKPMTKAPGRVLGALALVLLYTLSVDILGFYGSTAVFVPLVAYAFGYRAPVGLAVATVIVLAGIYLVFGLAMAQDFPVGRLWAA